MTGPPGAAAEGPPSNARWAATFLDELAAAGVRAVSAAPGSRSTPLVLAAAAHDDLTIHSHLDERSAAFYALGRARRTGRPTPVITTSGTAAAELHPAVLEADRGRVPFLALTADRPPVLRDSGANQTVDQVKLYGDAVRWYRELPAPADEARTVRRLRTDAARAVAAAAGPPAGPVHCNVPFAKPLSPPAGTDASAIAPLPDTGPERNEGATPAAAAPGHASETTGVRRPNVTVHRGEPTLPAARLDALAAALEDAGRTLLVCGPADPAAAAPTALLDLATAAGMPVLADPLSGVRFGPHVTAAREAGVTLLGGYDAVLDDRVTADWPAPDVVVRVGASPTSKPLREYLAGTGARQLLVDPAAGWREAEFVATDLVAAAPDRLAAGLAERVDRAAHAGWHDRLARAERRHRALADEADPALEGSLLATAVSEAPDPATIVVSNSMPVRDLDRFAGPDAADLTVLANRGASGIDGVTSTALGAGSATDEPLVAVLGDLAAYHDSNGLLAVGRCGVDATIVVINNDGGGIFHALPIAAHDPPFTEQFRTPHGLSFDALAEQYGLAYRSTDAGGFSGAYRESLGAEGATLLEVETDAAASHRRRTALQDELVGALGDGTD